MIIKKVAWNKTEFNMLMIYVKHLKLFAPAIIL